MGDHIMNKRKGFTLVELLVVVAIIAILATLTAVGATAAIRSARDATIAMNMTNVIMALEAYRAEHGEYPPDMTNSADVVRHIRKRWPRFVFDTGKIDDIVRDAYIGTTGDAAIDFNDNNARRLGSLVLWLGGFPDSDGTFRGFSGDPEAPFGRDSGNNNSSTNINNGTNSLTAANIKIDSYAANNTLMEMTGGKNVLLVEYATGKKVPCLTYKTGSATYPFVYFKGTSEGGNAAYFVENDTTKPVKAIDFTGFTDSDWQNLGYAYPYAEKSDNTSAANITAIRWYEPKKFQILHPGQDGNFGGDDFRSLDDSSAKFVKQADFDNITNASGNKRIQSIMP